MALHLDPFALNEIRERFLIVQHDFGEFGDQEGAYYENEREYKEALIRLFHELFPEDLLTGDPAEQADGIVRCTLALLTRPIGASRTPQNLLSWRYVGFLRRLETAERQVFARALAGLLAGDRPSPERLERFNATMWPAFQRVQGGNPYAITRSLPTLFLMLQNPIRDIYVRTETFNAASRRLLGRSLIENVVFDAAQYRAILEFAEAVRQKLVEWGWGPRDLIDVQSFLYVGTISDDTLDRALAARGR